MSHRLVNLLAEIPADAMTMAEGAILYQFCEVSKDHKTAYLTIPDLARRAKCCERAAHYILPRLVKAGWLTPQATTYYGRGHIPVYDIDLTVYTRGETGEQPERKPREKKPAAVAPPTKKKPAATPDVAPVPVLTFAARIRAEVAAMDQKNGVTTPC